MWRIFFATVLLLTLAQASKATPIDVDSSQSEDKLTIYEDYAHLVDAQAGKLIILKEVSEYYDGYSMLPFGSRKKAITQAIGKAKSSNFSLFLTIRDEEHLFDGSSPPPGKFMGGTYHMYIIWPVEVGELTSDSLLAEIIAHTKENRPTDIINKHVVNLIKMAEDKSFSKITHNIKEIIREKNTEGAPEDIMRGMVTLVAIHEGPGCAADLIKWAKYHKSPAVRASSYIELINMGEVEKVEDNLKQEKNDDVVSEVKDKLI